MQGHLDRELQHAIIQFLNSSSSREFSEDPDGPQPSGIEIVSLESIVDKQILPEIEETEVQAPSSSSGVLQKKQRMDSNGKPPPLQEFVKQAGDTGAMVLRRLAPFGLQIMASAAAYSAGLGLFQVIGMGLRVSCNHRFISSCLGCVGVGFSSALSGHVSRHIHRQMEKGEGPAALFKTPLWEDLQAEELLLDAVVGVSFFKLWRGKFSSVMPSDLREPGAFAYHSVPVGGSPDGSGAKYAVASDRAMLQSIFKRDGCHHCGSRSGSLIGDHIPPTKIFKEIRAAVLAAEQVPPHAIQQFMKQVRHLLRVKTPALRQQYYAQCGSCSTKQAALLRHNGSNPFIFHHVLVPPGVAPGVVAAFRHLSLQDFTRGPGSGSRGGGGGPLWVVDRGQADSFRVSAESRSGRRRWWWGKSNKLGAAAGLQGPAAPDAEEDDDDDCRVTSYGDLLRSSMWSCTVPIEENAAGSTGSRAAGALMDSSGVASHTPSLSSPLTLHTCAHSGNDQDRGDLISPCPAPLVSGGAHGGDGSGVFTMRYPVSRSLLRALRASVNMSCDSEHWVPPAGVLAPGVM